VSTITHLPGNTCPSCGAANTGTAEPGGGAVPSPGDYSICVYCGAVAVYDAAMHLQAVPPGVPLPPNVIALRAAWQAHRRRQPPPWVH
jgi:hypothetical protein